MRETHLKSKLGHLFISAASGFEIKLKEIGEKKWFCKFQYTHNYEFLSAFVNWIKIK